MIAVLGTCLGTLPFYAARKVTSLDGMNLGYYIGVSEMVGAVYVICYNEKEFFPSDP
jgi:hypothetical protein